MRIVRRRVARSSRVAVSSPGVHGYPNGVVSVVEPPVTDSGPEALPNIAPEDVESPLAAHSADRLSEVRVLMRVIRLYSLFEVALPAGARKGAR